MAKEPEVAWSWSDLVDLHIREIYPKNQNLMIEVIILPKVYSTRRRHLILPILSHLIDI